MPGVAFGNEYPIRELDICCIFNECPTHELDSCCIAAWGIGKQDWVGGGVAGKRDGGEEGTGREGVGGGRMMPACPMLTNWTGTRKGHTWI